MEPRKIALLTPSVRLLGARQSLLALAKALDPGRYVPVVACPRRGDLEEELRRAGFETHLHFLPPWRKAKFWPLIPYHVWKLRRWVNENDIHLLHCNEPHPTPYAVRVRKPTITHMRLSITPRLIRNYNLARADRVIVVSHAAAEPFRVWSDFEQRVRVIYNGLDIEEWTRAAASIHAGGIDVRAQLGLGPDTVLVGHIGLISARKQQHLLLEAARLLVGEGAGAGKYHFLIVGDPSPNEREYGERIVEESQAPLLKGRVTVWPFRREIAPVFAALDLNLLISNDEGFGRVAIEAGALGVPTIGTRIGGIPEVIEVGKTGLLIGESDARALAEGMRRLRNDAELRRAMGEAARARVHERFTIQAHARSVMDLYDEILPSPTR